MFEGLTKKFFNKMLKFCFPERDTEEGEPDDNSSVDGGKKGKIHHKGKEASFYVPIERKDDVEKMKVRIISVLANILKARVVCVIIKNFKFMFMVPSRLNSNNNNAYYKTTLRIILIITL